MTTCVNNVYEVDNASFQASLSLDARLGGGEILGGYDSTNKSLIFTYVNPCDPTHDIYEGWIWRHPTNILNKKIDYQCPNRQTKFLIPPIPNPAYYTDFVITQMNYLDIDTDISNIIVSCGYCTSTLNTPVGISSIKIGFIYSFNLLTGDAYTALDSGENNNTEGWYIKTTQYGCKINSIFTNTLGDYPVIIYGGYSEDSDGNFEGLLEILMVIEGEGLSESSAQVNSSLPLINEVVSINTSRLNTAELVNESGCLVIWQTTTTANATTTKNVHMRELNYSWNGAIQSSWVSNHFSLPTTIWSNFNNGSSDVQQIEYTSSCIDKPNNIMYIATNVNVSNGIFPMISAITGVITNDDNNIPSGDLKLEPAFSPNNEDQSNTNSRGMRVYNGPLWSTIRVANISFFPISSINTFAKTQTNNLFLSLYDSNNTQKYFTFIYCLNDNFKTGDNLPSGVGNERFSNVNSTILETIMHKDSAAQTNGSIEIAIKTGTISNADLTTLQVSLDKKVSGTLNDLQFQLFTCPNSLTLFAFGNYVNSPPQPSSSTLTLLNAISNICLSKGTQILCDQGIINIEKINTRKHTINNKQINHITQSIHTDDYLIKIKKNCLSSNSPSSDIICSGDHKILYKNNLIESKNLINEVYGIEKIKNDKRVLYNILMDKHEVIMANNTPVESLHPQNIIAMFYNNYNNPQAREFLSDKIGQMNKNNHYITEANKTNSIHLRNGTSKKTSIPLRIGNKK